MRIGSTLSSGDLLAVQSLNDIFKSLNRVSEQLSTAKQINRGSDNPAGLIMSESLNTQLGSIFQAQQNVAAASGVAHTADSGLSQASGLLRKLKTDILAAANTGGMNSQQIAAKQAEVDQTLNALNRVAGGTQYMGKNLLDGSSSNLTFAMSPDVSQTTSLSLPNVSSSALGGDAGKLSDLASGGSASMSSGNLEQAMKIVDTAQSQINQARTTVGNFEKYTAQSAQDTLSAMQVNISQAYSNVTDTNYASATSNLVRDQIMSLAAVKVAKLTAKSKSLTLLLLQGLSK